jgi:hypothetical protein
MHRAESMVRVGESARQLFGIALGPRNQKSRAEFSARLCPEIVLIFHPLSGLLHLQMPDRENAISSGVGRKFHRF